MPPKHESEERSTAAVERAHSDRARSGSKERSSLPCATPSEGARSASMEDPRAAPLPSLQARPFLSSKGGLVDPRLRATFSPTHWHADTCHYPRRGPFNSLHLSLREWPRLPFTARIERAQFHRARSASKKGTWPLPPPSFSGRALREHRRSTDHPPSHPLRRILLPRFFFCEPSIQDRQDHQREYR